MVRKTILIIDDDQESADRVAALTGRDRSLSCIGRTDNAFSGLEMIRRMLPDIVIMEYFMPGLDGIEVMRRTAEDMKLIKRPAFVMVSSVSSSRVIADAFSAGAAYFMIKPFDDRMLLRRLHELVKEEEAEIKGYVDMAVVPDGDPVSMQIEKLLKTLGIGPHLKGYCYLVDAVMMAVKKQARDDPSLTKVTYPAIARMNMTTSSRVERAIRHAIELAWEKGDEERMYEVVARSRRSGSGDSSPRKPTNGEFIACCSAVIREKMDRRYEDL